MLLDYCLNNVQFFGKTMNIILETSVFILSFTYNILL
jgi:hypothetical protein